ncbi:MAG TPA: serine/threonine-protein kinase [Streptosporangiaceae bacterium]|nr:serine/threonine-protein kinase [Streptosporangiaceae bacterium]
MPDVSPLRANDPVRVGSYQLTGRLGEGGQGTVYLGADASGERVAVKLLHPWLVGDAKARARFAGELGHAKRVMPFCTARVLDADAEGDVPYIVSEFIDGPSLAEVLRKNGPTTGVALDRLAIGTITALTSIHEAGIVHRDFKPGNVIIASDGPRVIDFGIARALDMTGTLTNASVGTPAYMAPEQFSGHPIGPPADVFAWACTMAFAANGRPPHGDDSVPAVLNRVVNQPPDLGTMSGPLRDIVAQCLAKDPAALRRRGRSCSACSAAQPSRRRRPRPRLRRTTCSTRAPRRRPRRWRLRAPPRPRRRVPTLRGSRRPPWFRRSTRSSSRHSRSTRGHRSRHRLLPRRHIRLRTRRPPLRCPPPARTGRARRLGRGPRSH